MSHNNEVISEEIEALQAIMMDEVDINYDDSGHPNAVKVNITPATAQNVEEQHVRVTLIVDFPPLYPDESPCITLRNPKGIDESILKFINHEINNKCEEFLGCPVVYEVIEVVRENLTANNTPSCPCAICLFHFTQSDSFSKTSCYHYFHCFCLGRYILNCEELAAAAEEQMNQQPAWMTREKREFLCPVCREPLEDQLDSSKLLENPPPEEGELLEDFSPDSPEIKALQERMSELYLQQKDKGGIIDLEEEKNRFLISAPEENQVEEHLHRRLRLPGCERPVSSSRGKCSGNPRKKPNPNAGRREHGGGSFWNSNKGQNGPRKGSGRNAFPNAKFSSMSKNSSRSSNYQNRFGNFEVIEDRSSHKQHSQLHYNCNGDAGHLIDAKTGNGEFSRAGSGGGRGQRNFKSQPRGGKGRSKASSQAGINSLEDKAHPQASS